MDLVVNQLSEIEAAAQKIMDEALLQKKEMYKSLDEQMKAYDEQVDIQAADTLDKLSKKLAADQEQNLKDLKTSTEKSVQIMESEYNTSHTQIAKKMLQALIRE